MFVENQYEELIEYGDTVEIYEYALVSKVGMVNGENPEEGIFHIMKEILIRTGAV